MAEHILQLHVSIQPSDLTNFTTPTRAVAVIPFTGTADGPLFTDTVCPGAVDCQTVNAAGVRHMCARYVLRGVDYTGAPCHIFVENNGWFSGAPTADGFDTVPTFLTDSAALAPRLHRSAFRGRGEPREGGVTILFYEL